jgi:hypothetical protein
MDVGALTREVVEMLTDAGIPATADTRDLNPPAVLVGAPSFVPGGRLAGDVATFTLWAVVPNAGRLAALDNLGPLVEQVTAVLACDAATPADLLVPDGGDPLPGYQLTATVRTCYEETRAND